MGKGLVTSIIVGIVFVVVAVIISFTVISNLVTVQQGIETASGSARVTGETGWANVSGYTLLKAGTEQGFTSPSIISATNTTSSLDIATANFSITNAGVVTNATKQNWRAVTFVYDYEYFEQAETVENLQSNLTTGIVNVSNKIPTVLLMAAVVIILGILVVLWGQYKRMNIGGTAQI